MKYLLLFFLLSHFCPNSRQSVQPYSFSRPVFRSGGSFRPYPCYPHCDNPRQKPRCSGLGKRFPPTSVDIALSKDGSDFKEALTQPITYDLTGPWAILPVVADFKTARARYVRSGPKRGRLPRRNPDAGQKTYFATDEIVVE